MTTHYIIKVRGTEPVMKISYRGGVFFKFEQMSGKRLTVDQVKNLGNILVRNEKDIPKNYLHEGSGNVTYTKIEKTQSYYQQYVSAWYDFYNRSMQMAPRFNGADGKHINQIKAHLTRVSDQDQEGLELFKLILDNWHKLDEFHKENTDLKYINSRLNVILNAIRKAGQAGTGGTDNSVRL